MSEPGKLHAQKDSIQFKSFDAQSGLFRHYVVTCMML